jgi:predicted aspartyl protease
MPAKVGTIRSGHPYVEISVSSDGKTGSKYLALIDTGFSGFVSLPAITATLLGLKPQTTSVYTLADGKPSTPIPLGYGYACVVGDSYVRGLIAFSQNVAAVVGMEFLTSCGHFLMVGSKGVILLSEKDMAAATAAMKPPPKKNPS